MNIKSLLLGSAAVLVAATGARAADAIVIAEPEPVEYVRVCDTYGAGYFYIPGTETCMRIHGYVRGVVSGGDNVYARTLHGAPKLYTVAGVPTYVVSPLGGNSRGIADGVDNDTYGWMSRAHVRLSTAAETELGTLRTYIDSRFQYSNGGDAGSTGTIRNAWIELGGFRMGMATSAFSDWTNGYGTVYNDDIINPIGKRTNFISYTFNGGNGFSGMIALEQGNRDGDNYQSGYGEVAYRDTAGVLNLGTNPLTIGTNYGGFYDFRRSPSVLPNTDFVNFGGWHYARVQQVDSRIDGYMPNVVGGVKYEQGWGGLSAVVAYDSFHEEFAGKVRLDVNATDALSLFLMAGYKTIDDAYNLDDSYRTGAIQGFNHLNNTFGVYRVHNSIYGNWGGDWAVWGGGQYRFNEDRTNFNLQLSYDDTRTFAAVANVEHKIVPGLNLIAELNYVSWNDNVGYAAIGPASGLLPNNNSGVRSSLRGENAVGGLVVLTRSF